MRLPTLDRDTLSDEQHELLRFIEEGPRGPRPGIGFMGPFGVWLHAPSIGQPAQALGSAVRFDTALPEVVKEVAICTVGAFYRAPFEFAAHKRLALEAGVPAVPLERLQRGEEPGFDGEQALAHAVAHNLLENHRVPDAVYHDAVAAFGETGVVELVTIVGYYCLISHTLNAFEVPLADGMEDPFPGG